MLIFNEKSCNNPHGDIFSSVAGADIFFPITLVVGGRAGAEAGLLRRTADGQGLR
jgi:hypothetical protein